MSQIPKGNSRYTITALARGLSVLSVFDEGKAEMPLSLITRKARLQKTTAFRLCHTLVALGYLQQDKESGLYRLGTRAIGLGWAALHNVEIREFAEPHLRELADICNETIHLFIFDGYEIVAIDQIRAPHVLNISLHIGSRRPFFSSAIGRAYLSTRTPEYVAHYIEYIKDLPGAAPYLKNNAKQLWEEIKAAREKSYGSTDQEFTPGIRTIAALVWHVGQEPVAGVSIGVPTVRTRSMRQFEAKFSPPLLKTVNDLSSVLGYRQTRMRAEDSPHSN